MLDLVIKGGTVVIPGGAGNWDIGVQGEHIVAVALPDSLGEAKKTIDATGKVVVPGGVEAHTHAGMPDTVPIWGSTSGGADELSQGALWGGTTTIVDFATVAPPESPNTDIVKNATTYAEHFKGNCYTDYAFHCTFRGAGASTKNVGQIKDLISAGFPSIKIFTTNAALKWQTLPHGAPPRLPGMIDMGQAHAIMSQTAKYGGIVAVHSEDDEIVQHNYQIYNEQEKWDWWYMAEIRSNLSEDLSVRRIIRVAEVTGSAMYIVHTSAREGVNAIAEARQRGSAVYGETILLYCSFNSENYKEPDGMKYHTYPGTKSETDRQRLWDGLIKGDLQILATDAISTDYAGKTRGRTVTDVQGGNNGIEIRMGIAYTDGVVKQSMSLERYAAITSTNPAKLLGIYPQKGAIVPGSDADITVIDPSIKKRASQKELHMRDYTPWEGREISGWPAFVMLRGKVVVEHGNFYGEKTDGKLLKRKIDSSVFKGPTVV